MAEPLRIEIDRAAVERLVNSQEGDVARYLLKAGLQVENEAKRLCPVDTGRLRSSITSELRRDGGKLAAFVGTNVAYACVLGAHTTVVTEQGTQTIGQVRAGQRVLTQTGEWREVIKTSQFPVAEKPDLVTLSIPWRKGKTHDVTLTLDHKVAVMKPDGRVTWVHAGAVDPATDRLFRRRKLAHNKGTGALHRSRCEVCGAPNKMAVNRFCSLTCRSTYWAVHGNPNTGSRRSDETRRTLSELAKGRRSANALAAWARHNGGTACERQVEAWLDDRGVVYERNYPVGQRFVDFWLPLSAEVIEADGAYWHRDQPRDVARDEELRRHLPDARITHIHFYDPRWTPPLDPEPLPGVRYVLVNPEPSHYVEPDAFEAVPCTIKRWSWRPSTTPRASKVPQLYDLSVEGVHSFVAGGVLVSNSWVEHGTSRMRARAFLRPALDVLRRRGF